jgi:hypothetical protein
MVGHDEDAFAREQESARGDRDVWNSGSMAFLRIRVLRAEDGIMLRD